MTIETRRNGVVKRRLRELFPSNPKAPGAGQKAYPAPEEPIASEIGWATWGPISEMIARVWRPQMPAVVVLSLPRSGSSWVGDILGTAVDALYLREPFTQTDLAVNVRQVFEPADYPALEAKMRTMADKAFIGLPDFRPRVVLRPDQWALKDRTSKRVVIKEVNPRACRWFVEHYQPKVVFLMRHPAATAWSSVRQQWLGPTVVDWEQRGREDRETLQMMWDGLKNYPNHIKLYYEDLCDNPVQEFQRLYEFAGLTWTEEIARAVTANSAESPQKARAWRTDASHEHLLALRKGFAGQDPAWSRWDDDWGLA